MQQMIIEHPLKPITDLRNTKGYGDEQNNQAVCPPGTYDGEIINVPNRVN